MVEWDEPEYSDAPLLRWLSIAILFIPLVGVLLTLLR